MSDKLTIFSAICDACGNEATEEQIHRLADYVRENFGRNDYPRCAEIALHSDVPDDLYTELSMLCGEAGV